MTKDKIIQNKDNGSLVFTLVIFITKGVSPHLPQCLLVHFQISLTCQEKTLLGHNYFHASRLPSVTLDH